MRSAFLEGHGASVPLRCVSLKCHIPALPQYAPDLGFPESEETSYRTSICIDTPRKQSHPVKERKFMDLGLPRLARPGWPNFTFHCAVRLLFVASLSPCEIDYYA